MRRVLAGVAVATAALLVVPPAPALAAPQQGLGHSTSPAQPYLNNPDSSDWLGSYVVNGEHVLAAQFAHLAPDSDEAYQAAVPVKTKWGTDLPAVDSARLAYLVFAHGRSPQNADTTAALAHLVHSLLSAPQNPSQLDPSNDFRHIAYDAPFHLAKLPAATQGQVTQLQAEATSQRGPWTVTVTPPASTQVGQQAIWSVHVAAASGDAVTGRAVHLTATGADLAGPASVTLDGSGNASVALTPTQAATALLAELDGPTASAVMRPAVDVDTTRVLAGADQVTTYAGHADVTAAAGVFTTGPRATINKSRPRVGRLLTASAGTTVPAGTAAFRWFAGGQPVGTGPTYRPTLADLGLALHVEATVTRPGYTAATASSTTTEPVRLAPAGLVVSVRGRAAVGSRLLVKAQGLAPREKCTIRFGGEPVRGCRADDAGRVRVRIPVTGVAPGDRRVTVQGAIPRRRGSDVVRVVA